MEPPPLIFTLFPYTTLFRSRFRGRIPRSASPVANRFAGALARRRKKNWGASSPQGSDRKSTRLNSSHTVTSYAVFCLKKKNQNNSHDYIMTGVYRAAPAPDL